MFNYSVALQGVRNAEQMLDRAARNLAAVPSVSGPAAEPPGDRVTLRGAVAESTLTHDVVTVVEARFGIRANLEVVAAQRDLERSLLDILA